ncbi:MAG: HNH endonuclease [Armatimonadetes bacterium]|nr:HNH endonuclease [Armatimonadota bacterium]
MPNPKDPEKLAAYRLKMSQIAKERGYGKWMQGRELSVETREKLSLAQKNLCSDPLECQRRSHNAREKGYGKWMEGRTLPVEVKEKIVAHKRGKSYEEIYGPRAEEEARKRRDSNRARFEGKPRKSEDARPKHNADYRYSEWRRAVFERDNFTCQVCGQRGGLLNAHHLRSWAKHPEARFEISNGLTVCADHCHKIKDRERKAQEQLQSEQNINVADPTVYAA